MDIDKKVLGQRIKNIRVNRQETMEQFAKKLNSGKSNVSKWESGKNVPNDITLKKIAELGGVSTHHLTRPETHERVKQLVEKLEEDTNVDKRYKELYDINFKYNLIKEVTDIIEGQSTDSKNEHYKGMNFDADNVVLEIIRNKIYDSDKTQKYKPFNKRNTIWFVTEQINAMKYDIARILKDNNVSEELINNIVDELSQTQSNIEEL
ncbi:helix-turn-helix domain-containing protein [Salinicoccus bachuensis]|uniref:Helix-turn-helix transcriptional regulator n=1 Tax=Salinicoccus bachuensis TaxID=3136731 RepID=A0ABZ3CKH6_9STAP